MVVLKKGQFFGTITRIFHDDGITISVTEYDESDQLSSEKHYHFYPNIFFILQGGVIEKCQGNSFENLTGSISFYRAGEPHQNIRKLFPSKSLNIEVEDSFFSKYNFDEGQLDNSIRKNPDAKFLMLQIYKEMEENDSSTLVSIRMAFLNLLARSVKLTPVEQWPAWMGRIYQLLNDRWNETLSLHELSHEAGVHHITISKHFSRYLGCTPGQYIRKLKIEKAISLIKKNNSLASVAFECGFADQSHFIRNFKNHTGYLPFEFKKITGS